MVRLRSKGRRANRDRKGQPELMEHLHGVTSQENLQHSRPLATLTDLQTLLPPRLRPNFLVEALPLALAILRRSRLALV